MSGALVISLDFELHWGVRDHVPMTPQTAATMRSTRGVVEELCLRFADAGVAATWATVGMLFARGRAEMDAFTPAVRPDYANPALDPFGEAVGESEAADPAHYARSLIERIRATPGQEIGTHTYAHYYCLDDRAGAAAFDADLASAVAIAGTMGIELRSIVFPRNQVHPACLEVLPRHGIRTYRGNAVLGGPGARQDPISRRLQRVARFADAFVPLSGRQDVPWREIVERPGLRNVRASMFLRAHAPRDPALARLHLRRVIRGMRHAAHSGSVFHLWWHPHNFARHPKHCFSVLDAILAEYARLQDAEGMRSLTMDEAADVAAGN